jgi:uncharacterized membrane protein
MSKLRMALTLTGFGFATWEAVDIFWIDVPAVAALFAVLFLGPTLWFWRRDSIRAAVALMLLFAVEAAVAPSLKHVMTVTKVTDFTLAIAGIALSVAVLVTRRRIRSSRPIAA